MAGIVGLSGYVLNKAGRFATVASEETLCGANIIIRAAVARGPAGSAPSREILEKFLFFPRLLAG
jgi:hypothetical protein